MTDQPYEWSIERGDGYTKFTRERPHVTYMTDSQSVHAHYWMDDNEVDAQGWGMTDLVCHGCGHATRFLFPAAALDLTEPFRPMRDAFVHDHRDHFALANSVLCPPNYRISETRDLRG